jgi:hypothetical protein
MNYPDRHHPCYFLSDALAAIGVKNEVIRDERSLGCWALIFPDFDNRVMAYLIDNRWEHEAIKEDPAAKTLLAMGALVCHAQKPDMERVGGHWLPLAASPGFARVSVAKTADCAMVGYVRDEGRARLLADVGAKFTLNLAQGVFGKQAVETYCGAHVGINIPTRYGHPAAYDSMNMRLPEIAACEIPPVTSHEDYLEALGFEDMETCVTYGAHRSIIEAVEIALDQPHIGFNAGQLIKERHTYRHRAEQVKQWLSE